MPLIPVNNAGQYGIIQSPDRQPHELPLNAWSSGKNVRPRDGMMEKFLGHDLVTTPAVAPYFLLPISTGGVYYWIYAGLAKLYQYDGYIHTNITRQSGGVDVDYNASAIRNWTGGRLGNIAILNNGVDPPQQWTGAGRAANLSNWPASTTCEAMRVFRRFLVAMSVTKSGVAYPQMVKWSHPAAAGAVPSTWDETDTTKDAGEVELKDTDGAVVDGAPLREHFVIYKEDSCYWMQFVGGVDVFRFPQMFSSFGILSRRCAVEYAKGKHAVFALGDVIAHDGATWSSIVSGRMRKWLFSQIDSANYRKCFVVSNPAYYEVWFCFPSTGNSTPNMALVWNWQENRLGVRDLVASHIEPGNVTLTSTGDIWDNDSATWDSDPSTWGEGTSNPAGKRLMVANSSSTKLQRGDSTNQFEGVNMTSYVERVGLALPLKVDGPPDLSTQKFVRGIWPRISGTTGGVVKVYFGKQASPDAPVTWEAPVNFTIGTSKFIGARVNTPLPAIRFESDSDIEWRLAGYEIDVVPVGKSYV